MLDHIATYRAGDSEFYAPRQRGTVIVEHDSSRYVYRKPWQGVRQFKRELLRAFGDRCEARISGQFPHYTIVTNV